MKPVLRKKAHGETLKNRVITGAVDRGVEYRVFSNLAVEDVTVKDSPAKQGFKFHNSDKPAALEVEGRLFNLVMRRCDVLNVRGDGIYATKIKGALIENCKVVTSTGKAADACQFAYENQETNISRDVWIRGNIFAREPDGTSEKGALVCEKTQGYVVEYNVLEGRNFGFSSIGDDAVVRSNLMQGARLNDYSCGYGVGEQLHLKSHHIYDNWIEDCSRGFSLSGFGDDKIVSDSVKGYQRGDIEIHDNVVNGCDLAFYADRPWSGSFRRNIIMRCDDVSVVKAKGVSIARNGITPSQDISENYLNDGSFLCTRAPRLIIEGPEKASVTPGTWTEEPDEIRLYWRDRGRDIIGQRRTSIVTARGMELSCVVLARKGENWMLAIAEMPWPEDGFVPRAWSEELLPWSRRYFSV